MTQTEFLKLNAGTQVKCIKLGIAHSFKVGEVLHVVEHELNDEITILFTNGRFCQNGCRIERWLDNSEIDFI